MSYDAPKYSNHEVAYGQPGGQVAYGQQSPQHVVVINQPMATSNVGGQPQNIRDWSTGLCGCFEDCATCAVAFFLPPCYMCWLASAMNENPCGAAVCGDLFAVPMRTKIRTLYGIKGSICHDACCVMCCHLCAMTQVHREMKNSGYVR